MREAALTSEQLLRTILPDAVARKLLQQVPASEMTESHACVTIAFINLEGSFYKRLVTRKAPAQIVQQLDVIFSHFDVVLERPPYAGALYKVESVGATYMVGAGLNDSALMGGGSSCSRENAALLARFCLDIAFECATAFGSKRIPLRVGLMSGPVVAGTLVSHMLD